MHVFPQNVISFFLFNYDYSVTSAGPSQEEGPKPERNTWDMCKAWSELLASVLQWHLNTCPFLPSRAIPAAAEGSPRAPLGLQYQFKWHQPHRVVPGS